MFHASMLCGYVPYELHVLESSPLKLQKDLSYEEELVAILDRTEKALRNKVIPLMKVLWGSHKVETATCQALLYPHSLYLHLNLKPVAFWVFH